MSILSTLDVRETLVEAHQQVVAEGTGRIYAFKYPNYNDDPRPQVLVLGYWRHPTTGNNLLGGINLNYMTNDEVERVRKALPLILRSKSLKDRYRAGRRLLPAIFNQFYRTYNKDYVQQITPSDFVTGPDKTRQDMRQTKTGLDAGELSKDVDDTEQQRDDLALRDKLGALKAQAPEQTGKQAPGQDKPGQDAEQGRELMRGLEPDGGRPTREISTAAGLDKGNDLPTGTNVPWRGLLKLAQRQKESEHQRQETDKQRQSDQTKTTLTKQGQNKQRQPAPTPAPVPALAPKPSLQKPIQAPIPVPVPKQPAVVKPAAPTPPVKPPEPPVKVPEPVKPPAPPAAPAPEPVRPKYKFARRASADALSHPPGNVGEDFVWPSPAAYIDWHRPAAFLTTPALSEGTRRPLLAVYNVITGETLLDRVEDHAVIIQEANWDFDGVIRLLPVRDASGTRIVPLHDGLPPNLIASCLRRIPALVLDHLLNDL